MTLTHFSHDTYSPQEETLSKSVAVYSAYSSVNAQKQGKKKGLSARFGSCG